MGFTNLLPRPLRIANFYLESKKNVAKNLDIEEKKSLIFKLEEKKGGEGFFLDEKAEPSMVVLIGKKDIGKIFLEIKEYEKALSYLNSAFNDLLVVMKTSDDKKNVYDNYSFITEYRAKAFSLLGQLEMADEEYNHWNLYLNNLIETEPSNTRATELYKHSLVATFNGFINGADTFPERCEEYYAVAKTLFEKFNQRDKGNDKIIDLLDRLS